MAACTAVATGRHRSPQAVINCPACGTPPAGLSLQGQIDFFKNAFSMGPGDSPLPSPDARTWREASSHLGRNDLPDALWRGFSERRLEGPELVEGLSRAWPMCEWPEATLGRDGWLVMWESALDLNEEYLFDGEVRPRSELPDEVVLYRGAAPEHASGMSWTDDIDMARWFRDRLGGEGRRLYRAEVDGTLVLARFRDRGEEEWVLDTDGVEPEVVD